MAEQQVRAEHLSDTQTQVLLAVYLSGPEESFNVVRKSAKTAEAAKSLQQLGYITMDAKGVYVTDLGKNTLVEDGYIDQTGQTTEFGQQYYQQAVDALNESYKYSVITDLLRNK